MPALEHGCDARIMMAGLAVTEYAREDDSRPDNGVGGATIKNVDIAAEPGQAFVISYTYGLGAWHLQISVDGTQVCNMLAPTGQYTQECRGYEQGNTRLPFNFAKLAIEDDESSSGHGKLLTKPGCIEVSFTQVSVQQRKGYVKHASVLYEPPAPAAAAANSKAGINGVVASGGAAEPSTPLRPSQYTHTPLSAPLVVRFRYLAAAFIPELIESKKRCADKLEHDAANPDRELAELEAQEAQLRERANAAAARIAALRGVKHEPAAKPERAPVKLSIDLSANDDSDADNE